MKDSKYNFAYMKKNSVEPYISLGKSRINVSRSLSRIINKEEPIFDKRLVIAFDKKERVIKLILDEKGYKFSRNCTYNFIVDKMPIGRYYLVDSKNLICKLK